MNNHNLSPSDVDHNDISPVEARSDYIDTNIVDSFDNIPTYNNAPTFDELPAVDELEKYVDI